MGEGWREEGGDGEGWREGGGGEGRRKGTKEGRREGEEEEEREQGREEKRKKEGMYKVVADDLPLVQGLDWMYERKRQFLCDEL